MSTGVFDQIREASAAVMERARVVSIDEEALLALTRELECETPAPQLHPEHHYHGEPDDTVAFILALDAINFGSGYFPHLAKRPGLSGYFTVATSLKEQWERHGPWTAAQLSELSADCCAEVIGQDMAVAEVAELMTLFARALGDLGRLLEDRYGGQAVRLVEAADRSAERLVALLSEMPFYQDVSCYDDLEVPFYKRAQLTSADLAATFDGSGYGSFDDLDQLTIFADNLVPHVLRRLGVLRYDAALGRHIDAGRLLEAGSPEEVEIRAGALHAVECLVRQLEEAGVAVTAQQLDYLLWTRGHEPEMKSQPRHRARTTYY